MKINIENFKWLFHIEYDEGIGGKCTCVQLIAINNEWSISKTDVLMCWWKMLVTSSELYLVFWSIYSILGTEKPYLLLFWTVVGGRVGYQAWYESCCVWLEMVCYECLGQSGIWTSLDGELCMSQVLNTGSFDVSHLCGEIKWSWKFDFFHHYE